jgi:hypothetical protein
VPVQGCVNVAIGIAAGKPLALEYESGLRQRRIGVSKRIAVTGFWELIEQIAPGFRSIRSQNPFTVTRSTTTIATLI